MNHLLQPLIDRFFPTVQPLPAGVYHYQAPEDSPFPYRLHLRIEPDGHGVLIVNASTIVHLNPTATEYAYHLVRSTPEGQAIDSVARRYRVNKETVAHDYRDLIKRLMTLIDTPDLDPVSFLDFERSEMYSGISSAPYRIDCALTYRLPAASQQDQAPEERVERELITEEWKTILEKTWSAGVPHVVFTGGEPTLRPDLCALIKTGEALGMVTGLITDGNRLIESGYLNELLQSGLDHVMLLLNPNQDTSWQALKLLIAEDIAVTVHVTLTHDNLPQFDEVLNRLVEMGAETISISTDDVALKPELQNARQEIAERHLRLVWDLAVPYSQFNPVALEMANSLDSDSTAVGPGRAWLYVEPDGDVLPGQGHYQNDLGNLLNDAWDTVWDKVRAQSVE